MMRNRGQWEQQRKRFIRRRISTYYRWLNQVRVIFIIMLSGLLLITVLYLGGVHSVAFAQGTCHEAMKLPIRNGTIVSKFNAPAQPWLSGHRGIDITAHEGDEIIAPANGTISFAGKVAGKSSVSIKYERWTLTFEPAQTSLSVGSSVHRGQSFAVVSGKSDHCDGTCIHWGVKQEKNHYEDPEHWLMPQTIRLVPVQ